MVYVKRTTDAPLSKEAKLFLLEIEQFHVMIDHWEELAEHWYTTGTCCLGDGEDSICARDIIDIIRLIDFFPPLTRMALRNLYLGIPVDPTIRRQKLHHHKQIGKEALYRLYLFIKGEEQKALNAPSRRYARSSAMPTFHDVLQTYIFDKQATTTTV